MTISKRPRRRAPPASSRLRATSTSSARRSRSCARRVSTLRGENDRLTQEHSDAAAERDTLRAALDAANDELTALRAEAEALRAENASLRAENDKLRPMAEQYSTIKEHLAGIELDAHQRAEEYERSVHERLAAMISDCRAHCDSVLSTLGNTCINVTASFGALKTASPPCPLPSTRCARVWKSWKRTSNIIAKRELCAAAQSSLFHFLFLLHALELHQLFEQRDRPSMPRSDESMHRS